MNTLQSIQILLSGIVTGCIIFQSAIIAPTIFTVVAVDSRGPILRKVFPKLFKLTAVLGLAIFLLGFFRHPESLVSVSVGGFTLLSGVVCDLLVPATNTAKDSGDDAKFAKLHRLSVILTMAALLANMFWVFLDK